MAKQRKTISIRDKRREVEASEKMKETGKATEKKKAPAKKAPRKSKAKKKLVPDRLRMVWGVFDNSNQMVAVFPFNQRDNAMKKSEELTEKGRTPFFVQPVKEAMPDSEDDVPPPPTLSRPRKMTPVASPAAAEEE